MSQPRQQNHSASALRDTVICRIQSSDVAPVAEALQACPKYPKSPISHKARHIFHHHGFGPEGAHKPHKLKDQIVTTIPDPSATIQRAEARKAFARGTSRQWSNSPSFKFSFRSTARARTRRISAFQTVT